jgi:uncharacterized C2H2 Zn-finger protein
MKRSILALLFMHRIFSMEADQTALSDPIVLEEFLAFLNVCPLLVDKPEEKATISPLSQQIQRIVGLGNTAEPRPRIVILNPTAEQKPHIAALSKQRPQFVCPQIGCCKLFTDFQELTTHYVRHRPSQFFTCDNCQKLYRSKLGYLKHQNKIHGIDIKKLRKILQQNRSLTD